MLRNEQGHHICYEQSPNAMAMVPTDATIRTIIDAMVSYIRFNSLWVPTDAVTMFKVLQLNPTLYDTDNLK